MPAVVVPGLGVVGRWRTMLEQPQRLLDQRQPGGRRIDPPEIRGALVNDRRSDVVGVISELAVRLLGDHAGVLSVAGYLERVDRPHVQTRQVEADRALRRRRLAQLDRPLPVDRRLGVAEHPLGGLGCRHPGWQFLGVAACGRPVARPLPRLTSRRPPPPGPAPCVRAAPPAHRAAAQRPPPRPAAHAGASVPPPQCLGQAAGPLPAPAALRVPHPHPGR